MTVAGHCDKTTLNSAEIAQMVNGTKVDLTKSE